jgi:prepilin-type N-terminal cleavage/methylation domain-containing protein
MVAGRRADDGFTLIETLIALAIMGVGMVAIMVSIGTAVTGSSVHRKQGDALTEVVSAAETLLNSRVTPYVACATTSSYQAKLNTVAVPATWTAQGWTAANALAVTNVEFWDGSTFGATCHDSDVADTAHFLRMQRLTVAVTAPGSNDVERIEIVKRYPS